jgi:hypothetical protein
MICRFVMLAAFALLPGMVLEGQTAGGEHLYFLSATPGTRANAGLSGWRLVGRPRNWCAGSRRP